MTVQLQSTFPELAQASQVYGVFSQVARKLGVTPQHVSQVAKGQRKSKRVLAELQRAIKKIRLRTQERAA